MFLCKMFFLFHRTKSFYLQKCLNVFSSSTFNFFFIGQNAFLFHRPSIFLFFIDLHHRAECLNVSSQNVFFYFIAQNVFSSSSAKKCCFFFIGLQLFFLHRPSIFFIHRAKCLNDFSSTFNFFSSFAKCFFFMGQKN